MGEYDETLNEDRPPVRDLSKPQRRALGVLIEKGLTVPESYPMTLKALTTGCNQKSNRSPVTNYSEDQMWQTLDELRELGLVGVIETETGRTERFRHYTRKRYPFSEPQLAIVAELLLRGQQSLGELRARASRMVKIETLDDLRTELEGLIEQEYVQASGDLGRRGIEVDHCFYLPSEGMEIAESAPETQPAEPTRSPDVQRSSPGVAAAASASSPALDRLQTESQELRGELNELKQTVSDLRDELDELKRSLGV